MALVDMKLSKKEVKKERDSFMGPESNGPKYPWGLSLDLNDEVLEKLGVSAKDFKVGEDVVIKAKAKIKRLGSNEDEADKRESIDLQITHLEVVSSDKFEEAFKEASEKKED